VKVERLEVVPYALRFKEPYVTARGRLEQRELVLVRLHSGAVAGLGEAAPLLLRGGASPGEIVEELERCRPWMEGAEADGDRLLRDCAALGVSPQSLAAIEVALLDLRGKQEGRPLWELLGAEGSQPVQCNATLVAGEPQAVAANAVRWEERGFRTFKLKVGMEGDVAQVRAVRQALDDRAAIRLDANGAWTEAQAVRRLRKLEHFGVELVEQPAATLEQMAHVRRQTGVRVAADESVASVAEARAALMAGACDCATVKIAKVGGLRAALAIAAELPVYLSSALDGPVGIAAAGHLAQALPDAGLAHGLATTNLFANGVATREWELSGSQLVPSDGPGLGVEIDERALELARL
jgi:L-Ala-D/L-Glu epimerase / N-acetyl-D-glutamate racemase